MSDFVNAFPRAIGELGGAVQSFLGLTRHSRLRAQIRDSLVLYSAAKAHSELHTAQADLARVITLQTAQLLAATDPSRARQRDWSGAIVGFVFTGFVGARAWVMWVPWHLQRNWWGWIPIIATVGVGFLFLAASIGLLRRQPPKEILEPAAEGALGGSA